MSSTSDLAKGLSRYFPRFAAHLAVGRGDVENVLQPASESDVAAIEQQAGCLLPLSYKRFLQVSRGFTLFGGSVQFGLEHPFVHDFQPLSVLTPVQLSTLRRKGGVWPPPSQGMLCFAEFFLEADGDQVLFDTRKSDNRGEYPVVYYAHEDRPPSVRVIAAGFGEFLECLFEQPGFSEEDADE